MRISHNEGAGPKEVVQTDEGTAQGKVGCKGRGGRQGQDGVKETSITLRPLGFRRKAENQVTGGAAGPD